MLHKMAPAIRAALPKHVTPERMGRVALTALNSNADLAKCTPASFLGSVMQCAQLGLEPNTPLGHAYLIPYKSTCTLVIGYQGMLDLARRSGLVKAIYAHAVKEGDLFEYEYGLEQRLKHVPDDTADRSQKPLTHVYAVAKLKDGEPIFTVLSRFEIEAARSRSMAKNSGPWRTDYEAMALKTAVRRLWRWLPKSAEQSIAMQVDERDDGPQAFSSEVVQVLQQTGLETQGEPISRPEHDLPEREPGEEG